MKARDIFGSEFHKGEIANQFALNKKKLIFVTVPQCANSSSIQLPEWRKWLTPIWHMCQQWGAIVTNCYRAARWHTVNWVVNSSCTLSGCRIPINMLQLYLSLSLSLTCLVFSRICLRAISKIIRCRSTSSGFTIDSDGFVLLAGATRLLSCGWNREQTGENSGCEY